MCARIFTKINLVVSNYLISLSLKFGKDPCFCCGDIQLSVRGVVEIKNVTKVGKSPKGGVSIKNQKVQNSKFGLFDKRGGGGKPTFLWFFFKCK